MQSCAAVTPSVVSGDHIAQKKSSISTELLSSKAGCCVFDDEPGCLDFGTGTGRTDGQTDWRRPHEVYIE